MILKVGTCRSLCKNNATTTQLHKNLQFMCQNKSHIPHIGALLSTNSYQHKTPVKHKQSNKQLYSTQNRHYSNTLTVENIFGDWNKERIKERLLTVKPVIRPTKVSVNPRKAAVLVPLCTVKDEPSLLFMMRSLHLNNHAGEICFPGGMQDKGDNSLVETALRETREETGLDTSTVDIWGSGTAVPSRKGHLVTPVIGYCGEVDVKKLTPNQDEVDSVFTIPISTFLKVENQRQTQFRYMGAKGYTLPVFTGGDHTIWGLTAILTHQILTIIAPELYKFKLRHRR